MKDIDFKALTFNPMRMVADEWMLITAGCRERGFNTMTARWGHFGAVWGGGGLPSTVIYLRPQRYTREFMDREEFYTLSFFPEEYRKQLAYLGTRSGRDEDKVAKAGLTPIFSEGVTYFEEARLVFVCRKLYRGRIEEAGFVDKSLVELNYPEKDFHYFYIGEIVHAMAEEES